MEYIKAFNSLLFPSKDLCYFCREEAYDLQDFLCCNCRGNIEVVNKRISLDSPYIKEAFYSTSYNKYIRKKVQDYKFHSKAYLYKPMAELMLKTLEGIDIDFDIIVYVPSHRRKEAVRGYNQSQLLAKYIGRSLNIPLSSNNLIKKSYTKDQNKLGKIERMTNLRNSFYLKNRDEITGKKVLLIDDIITTGSTMMECSKVLVENGAGKIIGLALTSSHKP